MVKKKSKQVELITFDEAARSNYLTGFHKRNVERKKASVKRQITQAKALKTEARKEKRASRKELIKDQVERIEAVEKITLNAESSTAKEVVESQKDVEFGGKKVTVTISSWKEDEEEPVEMVKTGGRGKPSAGRVVKTDKGKQRTGGKWVKRKI
ncbi:nucleolar protein 12-domain-containing protein [Chytridium lagenaria]|nr:nucleolar protein 12-domain-containing protein [Chytridium lagenaria]